MQSFHVLDTPQKKTFFTKYGKKMSIFTKINKSTSDFHTKTARNLKFSLHYDELVVAL